MKSTNLLSLPFTYSNKKISFTRSTALFFVRYSWSDSDERIFYLDQSFNPIETSIDLRLFPGLEKFITYCSNNRIRISSSVNEDDVANLISIDESRGPQSFAFGHYMVDILPLLSYIQLFKNSIISSLPPLFIYGLSKWQEDLHDIFSIPIANIFPLDSYKSILDIKTTSGQRIRLYKANISFIACNYSLIRATFAGNLVAKRKQRELTPKLDILFLFRKKLGSRPIRWTNHDEFESLLHEQTKFCCAAVDPAQLMPSELMSYVKQTTIVVSPPGSSAYIPLHVSQHNSFIVMPISYNCNVQDTWNYTLSMFSHYEHKLILVSNSHNTTPPSASAWDKPFKINYDHLMDLIEKLILIINTKMLTSTSGRFNTQNHAENITRCKIHHKSLIASLPKLFFESTETPISS